MAQSKPWAIRPQVPDEVYTDRQNYIEYFYKASIEAIDRRTMSTVLLGQRRMGKTEIFKRVVNRLFFEQDHANPKAVVPVYFKFPDELLNRWDFSIIYVENFLRWYTAFKMNDATIISERMVSRQHLPDFIKANIKMTQGLIGTLNTLEWLLKKEVTIPEQSALTCPKYVSESDDSTIALFLDEFQNTHLPQFNFRVVGFMQEAVESNTCPHFVTGSAMSILSHEILGRGSLFGRFASHPIDGFTHYYGEELANKAADYYGAKLDRKLAPVVSERCGGNPFYITAVVRQAAKQQTYLHSEIILNKLLSVDLSSGFIWAELHDQVTRWIDRLNDYNITKWILYLASLEEEKKIDLTRIQKELRRQENQQIEIDKIRDVMVKLSRGDLIDYKEVGGYFTKINDPILKDFLKVWGRIEVVGENQSEVLEETMTKFNKLQKRFSEYKGYLAEVYMIQVLWNSQHSTLPGNYFHCSTDVQMPDHFIYIDQRSRLGAGKGLEIDVFASAGTEIWIAESKWWTKAKVGTDVVNHLLKQAEIIKTRKGENLDILRIWLFAHNGVTEKAESLIKKHHILWSNRKDLDALLNYVNLRTLPVINDE